MVHYTPLITTVVVGLAMATRAITGAAGVDA